ncbi:MAG TPA: energy transducer TonB [Stellaceae bacterium]|nr:energy transducer TonB [Stellaceae bacterium]
MTDGNLRSVDGHASLIVPEAAGAEAAPAAPFLAAAPLRIVLSEATDLWGVQPSGWLAASLFFTAIAAGGALLPWRVAPPPAWPDDSVRFRVVFEEPAPIPAAPEIAALPPPAEPPPSAAPVEPPAIAPAPETAVTEVEPEPSPIATAPELMPLPKPPTRKPPVHHASAAPPAAAPQSVVAETTGSTAQTAQVAAVVTPVARGLSRPPSLDYGPKPDYPAAARMHGLQGRVLLHIEIAADGTPANVSVEASSGHVILDRAAMTTVRNWRFHPALRDGVPVESARDLPVDFRLED